MGVGDITPESASDLVYIYIHVHVIEGGLKKIIGGSTVLLEANDNTLGFGRGWVSTHV